MKNYLSIIQALAENRGVQYILDMITALVDTETQAISSICLIENNTLISSSSHQLPLFYTEGINGLHIAKNVGSCGHSAATGEVTIVHDLWEHSNWQPLKELITKANLRSCWSQPIISSKGKVLGTFAIYQPRPHTPSDKEQKLLFSMAHLASIAIEREVEIKKREETETLFKKVFQESSDGMIILHDRKIIDANQSFLNILGYDEVDEIRGMVPDHHPLTPSHQPCGTPSKTKRIQIQQDMEATHNNRFEWQHLKKNGEPVMVEVCATHVIIDNQSHTLGTICDITKRKQLEDQLHDVAQRAEASSRSKSNFLAMMSHEIRTPMNGILGFADLLQGSQLSEEQQKLLLPILNCSKSLMVILNDILDFSKLEANKIDIESIPCDLSEIIQTATKLFSFTAKEQSTTISLQLSEQLSDSHLGDPTRIYQIISNLVSNAVKFTENGSIQVIADVLEDTDNYQQISIAVKDTGIGIAKDKIDDLFNAFEQVEQSTTREFGGTGLGLTISKALIELMHGTISVDSNSQGTCFTVNLKLFKVEENTSSANTVNSHTLPRNLKVLAVDDNIVNQTLIKQYVKKIGYDCDIAQNGQEAYDLCQKSAYDLILMDIQMPKMNGLEATRKIRLLEKSQQRSASCIVALSANAFEDEKRESLNAGMNCHLIKPCKVQDIQNCITDYISN